MKEVPRIQRQALACGFEPALVKIRARPWSPPGGKHGLARPAHVQPGDVWPSVCAGYSTRLPEVAEAAAAHTHWKHGALALHLEETPPHENLMLAITVIDRGYGAVERYLMIPREDGGGREPPKGRR